MRLPLNYFALLDDKKKPFFFINHLRIIYKIYHKFFIIILINPIYIIISQDRYRNFFSYQNLIHFHHQYHYKIITLKKALTFTHNEKNRKNIIRFIPFTALFQIFPPIILYSYFINLTNCLFVLSV